MAEVSGHRWVADASDNPPPGMAASGWPDPGHVFLSSWKLLLAFDSSPSLHFLAIWPPFGLVSFFLLYFLILALYLFLLLTAVVLLYKSLKDTDS